MVNINKHKDDTNVRLGRQKDFIIAIINMSKVLNGRIDTMRKL